MSSPTMDFPKYPGLPTELRLKIIQETLDSALCIRRNRVGETPKRKISPYACVDREWNQAVELQLFKRLQIFPDDLAEFAAICGNRPGRLSQITPLFLSSPPTSPGTHPYMQFLFKLFEIMRGWKMEDREHQGLIELRLKFSFADHYLPKGPQHPYSLDEFPEVPVIGSAHEPNPTLGEVHMHPCILAALYQKLPNLHHASLMLPCGPSDSISTQDVITGIMLTILAALDSLRIHKPRLVNLDLRADHPEGWIPLDTTLLPIMECLKASPSPWTDRLVSLKIHHSIIVQDFLLEASKTVWPNLKNIELVGVVDVNYFEGKPVQVAERAVAEETCSNMIEVLAMAVPSMPKATDFRVEMSFMRPRTTVFNISMHLGNVVTTDKPGKMLHCGSKFVSNSNNGVAKVVGMYIPGSLSTKLQEAVRYHRRQELEVFYCSEGYLFSTMRDRHDPCGQWNQLTESWDPVFANDMDMLIFRMGRYYETAYY